MSLSSRRRLFSSIETTELGEVFARHAGTCPKVDVGLIHRAAQGLLRDAHLAGHRCHSNGHGRLLLGLHAHEPHASGAQLVPIFLGMLSILSDSNG